MIFEIDPGAPEQKSESCHATDGLLLHCSCQCRRSSTSSTSTGARVVVLLQCSWRGPVRASHGHGRLPCSFSASRACCPGALAVRRCWLTQGERKRLSHCPARTVT
eukprot:2200105-Rhodomonas_salina.5